MNPPKSPDPELFIVVCTDFHAAHGFFTSAQDAAKVARDLTDSEDNECQYVPVVVRIVNGRLEERPSSSGPITRGYL